MKSNRHGIIMEQARQNALMFRYRGLEMNNEEIENYIGEEYGWVIPEEEKPMIRKACDIARADQSRIEHKKIMEILKNLKKSEETQEAHCDCNFCDVGTHTIYIIDTIIMKMGNGD
jgi:hypothetical protein